MYVEPSAMLAILKEESDATLLMERLAVAPRKLVSVIGKVEAAISLGRSMKNHDIAPELVDGFCQQSGIEVVPVYPDLFDDVMKAYRRFGKGTGHPAGLNFGDCFSYAYSKRHGIPLLYKGDDFSRTDVEAAI